MIFQIIYVSSATGPINSQEIENLVSEAKIKNQSLGITGMLLFNRGTFMQLIEGQKDKVIHLFNRIENDKRHRGQIVILKRECKTRTFPDWTMGYRNLDLAIETKNESIFKIPNFGIFQKEEHSEMALTILKKFSER